jgi:hypothetical protein
MARPERFPIKLVLGINKRIDQALADWRRHQADLPSRSEAIRRLIAQALSAEKAKGASR